MLTIHSGRGILYDLEITFSRDRTEPASHFLTHPFDFDEILVFEFRLSNSGMQIHNPVSTFSIKRSSIIQDLPRLIDLTRSSLWKLFASVEGGVHVWKDNAVLKKDWIIAYQAALVYVMSAAVCCGAIQFDTLPQVYTGSDIYYFADMLSQGYGGVELYLSNVLGIRRSDLSIEEHILIAAAEKYHHRLRGATRGRLVLTDLVDVRQILLEDGEHRRRNSPRPRDVRFNSWNWDVWAEPIQDPELLEKSKVEQEKRDAADIYARDLLFASFPVLEDHEYFLIPSKMVDNIFYRITKITGWIDQVAVHCTDSPTLDKIGYLCLEVNSPDRSYVVSKWDRILQRCLLIRDREQDFWKIAYFHGSYQYRNLVEKMGGQFYTVGSIFDSNDAFGSAICHAFGVPPGDVLGETGRLGNRGTQR